MNEHPTTTVTMIKCRRCKDVVPAKDSEYQDEWEVVCRPCYEILMQRWRRTFQPDTAINRAETTP